MVNNLPAMQETRVRSLGRENPLEEEMATHSSILAWRIPWTEEPDGLQPMGSQRVWHDWRTNTVNFYFKLKYNIVLISGVQHNDSIFILLGRGNFSPLPLLSSGGRTDNKIDLRKINWRRRWHPTPVLLPGKSHGRRSLVGCSPWNREELDTTERLHFPFSLSYIGEGNGNPLQCSCLENPRDGGAWWAAVYGVTQSRTLKWLSSSSSKKD